MYTFSSQNFSTPRYIQNSRMVPLMYSYQTPQHTNSAIRYKTFAINTISGLSPLSTLTNIQKTPEIDVFPQGRYMQKFPSLDTPVTRSPSYIVQPILQSSYNGGTSQISSPEIKYFF